MIVLNLFIGIYPKHSDKQEDVNNRLTALVNLLLVCDIN